MGCTVGRKRRRHLVAFKFRDALEAHEGSKTNSYSATTDPGSVALHFLSIYPINSIISLSLFLTQTLVNARGTLVHLSYERLTFASKRPSGFASYSDTLPLQTRPESLPRYKQGGVSVPPARGCLHCDAMRSGV